MKNFESSLNEEWFAGFKERILDAFQADTVKDVAEKMQERYDLNYQTIGRYLKGERVIPVEFILQVHLMTGSPIDWLLKGGEKEVETKAEVKIEEPQNQSNKDQSILGGPLYDKCIELLETVSDSDDSLLEKNLIFGIEALIGMAEKAIEAASKSGSDEDTGGQKRRFKKKPGPRQRSYSERKNQHTGPGSMTPLCG